MTCTRPWNKALSLALLGALALAPWAAHAVDGVVLIDQNKALAGAVTPGDTAGFPVTISQSGSYRLASNLTVPFDVDGIVITVPNVTVDLNGFTIGTNNPGSYNAGSAAIRYTGPEPRAGLAIRNGIFHGYVSPLRLGATWSAQTLLKDLYITPDAAPCCGSIAVGSGSVVSNVSSPDIELTIRSCPVSVADSMFQRVFYVTGSARCTVANTATIY